MNAMRLAWIIFAITLLCSVTAYTLLPADTLIPVHWNLEGEVDRMGSLMEGLFLLPAISLGLLLLMQFLSHFEPRKENLAQSIKAKGWIVLAVVMLMSVISLANIAVAFGYDVVMTKLIMVAIMLMMTVIGNFMSKVRSNFFIGIRTPWTLSNDNIWRKTHRLGGRLFMLAGVIGIPFAFILEAQAINYLVLGLILPAALIPVAYSWYLWHQQQK